MNAYSNILVADDDYDDVALLKYAFKEAEIKNPVSFVDNGEELLSFLKSAELNGTEMPGLILLDLNMPKVGGHAVIKAMKESPTWRRIPILVFSTSDFDEDIKQVYDLGGASYIVKPPRYADLLKLVMAIKYYWIESVALR